jgi:hypothetical protein
MILEAAVLYVDSEFYDVLSADACFVLFVGFTIHLLWRASLLTELVAPKGLAGARKLWVSLGLTPYREAVFSGFCGRKDGKVV